MSAPSDHIEDTANDGVGDDRLKAGNSAVVEDYKVGYGKPPKKSQFKAGQSGNRKGRPRKSENFSTIARRLSNERMTIREGGREFKVTKFWLRVLSDDSCGCAALGTAGRLVGRIYIRNDDDPGFVSNATDYFNSLLAHGKSYLARTSRNSIHRLTG